MKTTRQLTLALLIATIIIILIGGIMLLSDTSGKIFGLYTDDLQSISMKNFAPIAWLLLITITGFGLVTAFFTFIHKKGFPVLIIVEGIILLLWCIMFIAFIPVSAITPIIFGITGAAFILLGRLINKQQKDISKLHTTFKESKDTHHSSARPKSQYHKHRKRGH